MWEIGDLRSKVQVGLKRKAFKLRSKLHVGVKWKFVKVTKCL